MYRLELDGQDQVLEIEREDLRARVTFVIKAAGQIATRNHAKAGAQAVREEVQKMLVEAVKGAREGAGTERFLNLFVAALADSVAAKAGATKDHYDMWHPLDGCTVVVQGNAVAVLTPQEC